MYRLPRLFRNVASGLLFVVLVGSLASPGHAQERPDRRQTQSYVPPEQLVSFNRDTPLNQFIELITPVFEREMGKPVIDPQNRSMPIGVPVSGMHFLDAFEQVLEVNGLTYRETETAFLVQSPEEAPDAQQVQAESGEGPLASLDSREIRINAILFNMNLTKVRNLGLSWNALFGPLSQGGGQGGGAGGGGGGGGGGGAAGGGGQSGAGGQQNQFTVKTENLFDSVEDVLNAPDQISLNQLRRFFNLLEQDDVGRTIANPQVTVQSARQGQIQIGQDVPIQTQDFAGNTVTQFFETGIIVDVTPTLITEAVADTAGAPEVDFIHLDVRVEDSNSQPSATGPVINRNQAETQVLLLDGESTAIGGLISTQKTTTRSGIPVLKDLPGWLFGLRYIFGSETTNVSKQELIIVLQAEVVDRLQARANRPYEDDLIDQRRRQAREALRRLGERYGEKGYFPRPGEQNTPDLSEEQEAQQEDEER